MAVSSTPRPLLILPVEVCERVIDYAAAESSAYVPPSGLAPQYQLRQRHMDLVACALTCRAWLARSIFHLSTRLMINSRVRLEQVTRFLKDNPTRAASISSLYICSPARPYTPEDGDQRFSQWSHLVPLRLIGLLPSLDKLVLVDLNWRHFHPSFFVLAPKFTASVKTLWIHRLLLGSPAKYTALLAMFPLLRELRVSGLVYFNTYFNNCSPITPIELSTRIRVRSVLEDLKHIEVLSATQISPGEILSGAQILPVVSWLSDRTPHLRTLRLDVLQAGDALRKWLQQCSSLTDLGLKFGQFSAEEIEQTVASIDLSNVKALQSLTIEGNDASITSFAQPLSTLSGTKTKQIALILATPLPRFDDFIRTAATRWRTLDSLLSKTSYPKLERVKIVVKTSAGEYAIQELLPVTYARGILQLGVKEPFD